MADQNFPVAHLSYSAIREYCHDRQMFYKKYIRLEFDDSSNPSFFEGRAVHKLMEAYYVQPSSYTQALRDAIIQAFVEEEAAKVDWGKTGSVEKSIKVIQNASRWLIEYMSTKYTDPLSLEEKIVAVVPGVDVPLKGTWDYLGKDFGIVDYKTCSSFSDLTKENPAYTIQANIYAMIVEVAKGKRPEYAEFIEVKKSENRDKSPQVQVYRVEINDQSIALVKALIERITRELSGQSLMDPLSGVMQFVPNFYDSQESWEDFTKEIIGDPLLASPHI